MNVKKLAPYAKSLVAVLGALLLLAKALTDGNLSSDEVSEIVGAAVLAYGVWRVPNKVLQ